MDIASTLLHSPAAKQWKAIGVKRRLGLNVPLFSIHTAKSSGIGEYLDLLPLIDFSSSIGSSVLQLLPLNDTGPESSPYSAISAFALNPIHLSLNQLPFLGNFKNAQAFLPSLQALNRLDRVDYLAVRKGKEEFLRLYYHETAKMISRSPEYQAFLHKNPWLEGYALFKAIKIKEQWKPWREWNPSWQNITESLYRELVKQHQDEIAYHIFLQFHCFQQMSQVKQYAKAKGVCLKGDIPILISPESADVWLYGSLFLLYYSAGAPPDMYSKEGQSWGSPIYDWEEMEKQHYQWWKVRLQIAEMLYDIYRLDHIVGFYRIYAIPEGAKGPEGRFIPEDRAAWIPQGDKIMRMMLQNSSLLPIGEDLGTIPDEVRIHMRTLGIPGTKVMRWERRWNQDKSYIHPKDYLKESLTTVSTHDSETLHEWWLKNPEEAKAFCQMAGLAFCPDYSTDIQLELLRIAHQSSSLFQINLLQEYLALIPEMTRLNPADERVNIPGTISIRNWSVRLIPSIEEIARHDKLNALMTTLFS